MKKTLIWGLIIFILVIIAVPIVMYFFVDQSSIGVNNIDKSIWLSFWGTYIGACIGGITTYISLLSTVIHYQEEAEMTRRNMEKAQKEQDDKYRNDIRRQLLFSVRPLIIIEQVRLEEIEFAEEMDRYVYDSDEPKTDLRIYETKKEILFRLRNIGVGPAENVNIKYNSSEYDIDGFNDRKVSGYMEGAPVLYQKMSVDVPNNDYIDVNLTLHFSKQIAEKRIYHNEISCTLFFQDCRHNEMERTITLDLENKKVVGWNSQRYCKEDNQKLFDGSFE